MIWVPSQAAVLALPATSSVLPDCWKKASVLLQYLWLKRFICENISLCRCFGLKQVSLLPLPTSLLRGFNNFMCARGPDEEKSCVHTQPRLGGTIPSPPSGGARHCTNNVDLFQIAKIHISFLFYCHIINKWGPNAGISMLFQFVVLLEMIFVFSAAVRRKNKGHNQPTKTVACNSKWQWHISQ